VPYPEATVRINGGEQVAAGSEYRAELGLDVQSRSDWPAGDRVPQPHAVRINRGQELPVGGEHYLAEAILTRAEPDRGANSLAGKRIPEPHDVMCLCIATEVVSGKELTVRAER
jgi:hypothetical protein